MITDNVIQARVYGIFLIRTDRATVTHNHVSGEIGPVVEGASNSNIQDNTIVGRWQGILLKSEAYRNQIVDNSILGIKAVGIALEPGVTGNIIRTNRVICAPDASCLTVDAQPRVAKMNKITGNRP